MDLSQRRSHRQLVENGALDARRVAQPTCSTSTSPPRVAQECPMFSPYRPRDTDDMRRHRVRYKPRAPPPSLPWLHTTGCSRTERCRSLCDNGTASRRRRRSHTQPNRSGNSLCLCTPRRRRPTPENTNNRLRKNTALGYRKCLRLRKLQRRSNRSVPSKKRCTPSLLRSNRKSRTHSQPRTPFRT